MVVVVSPLAIVNSPLHSRSVDSISLPWTELLHFFAACASLQLQWNAWDDTASGVGFKFTTFFCLWSRVLVRRTEDTQEQEDQDFQHRIATKVR